MWWFFGFFWFLVFGFLFFCFFVFLFFSSFCSFFLALATTVHVSTYLLVLEPIEPDLPKDPDPNCPPNSFKPILLLCCIF